MLQWSHTQSIYVTVVSYTIYICYSGLIHSKYMLQWSHHSLYMLQWSHTQSIYMCYSGLIHSLYMLQCSHTQSIYVSFTDIICFNCKHFLFLYIVKQKKFSVFIKKSLFFFNLMKKEFCWRQIFKLG